jgi:hypothetical protein
VLPGNDSFAAVHCNGKVISEPLLNNGRLTLVPVFRFSAVTLQNFVHHMTLRSCADCINIQGVAYHEL